MTVLIWFAATGDGDKMMRFCPAFHVVQLMRQASWFVFSNIEIEESSNPKPIWPGTVLLDRKHPDWLACYPQQGEFLVLRLVALCKSTITTSELYGIKRAMSNAFS